MLYSVDDYFTYIPSRLAYRSRVVTIKQPSILNKFHTFTLGPLTFTHTYCIVHMTPTSKHKICGMQWKDSYSSKCIYCHIYASFFTAINQPREKDRQRDRQGDKNSSHCRLCTALNYTQIHAYHKICVNNSNISYVSNHTSISFSPFLLEPPYYVDI